MNKKKKMQELIWDEVVEVWKQYGLNQLQFLPRLTSTTVPELCQASWPVAQLRQLAPRGTSICWRSSYNSVASLLSLRRVSGGLWKVLLKTRSAFWRPSEAQYLGLLDTPWRCGTRGNVSPCSLELCHNFEFGKLYALCWHNTHSSIEIHPIHSNGIICREI